MSLLQLYQDRLGRAITAYDSLSDEVTGLLQEGATLEDERLRPLMENRQRAAEEIDQYRDFVRREQASQVRRAEDDAALEAYMGADIRAPRTVTDETQARINGIVVPSLRALAIQQPALCSDEYRSALNECLRQSLQQRKDLPLEPFLLRAGLQANLMELVTDELGGYTVPPDIQSEILRNIPHFATMRQLASVTPTTSSLVEWILVQRKTGTGKGIYTGTFVGAMVSDLPAATAGEADLKFTMLNIPVRKSRVIGWFSEDFVSDSAVDILEFVRDEGALNLALLEDQQFLTGSGANGEVLGIMNHPQASSPTGDQVITRDISGSTADTISNTTTNRGSESALLNLIDDVAAQYRVGPGVAMIGHSKTRTKLRGLVSPAGHFVFRDELASEIEASGRAGSVEGVPFYVNDNIAQDGTDGNKVLIVGGFRHYRIVDRQRLSIRVSIDQKFDVEQIGLRLNSRFGGHITNPEAFAIGIV